MILLVDLPTSSFWRGLAIVLSCAWILGSAGCDPADVRWSFLEREILEEINVAREFPDRYADLLEEERRSRFTEDDKVYQRWDEVRVRTSEGVAAVEEAIEFLRQVESQPVIVPSRGMHLGALDHVRDQGPTGQTGHTGPDGSMGSDRVNRYGQWRQAFGENIAYGPYGDLNARDVVLDLIIDDEVPDRGHRHSLFNSRFLVGGVACGDHHGYGTMCVITLSGAYQEDPG